jgi:4a-hydroxytetrahydrobiopterin dehydratase
MNSVAIVAQDMDRNFVYVIVPDHPEWNNCYNTVTVTLNTHDVQGLTIKDFILAHAMVPSSSPSKGISGP